ncbi:MAG TPA: phage holin family protein [Polyangiaceae bacterium]|nr:phage holin family protein [Polyangiaceae bacterium]
MNSPVNIDPLDRNSTTPELVKEVLADARELLTLEVRMAVDEAREEVLRVKRAAIAGAVAVVLVLLGAVALLVALILALGGAPWHALAVGGVLLLLACGGAAYAYSIVPKNPLAKTRERLRQSANQLKEHVA